MDTDAFGITRLYPTAGEEWASRWHVGGRRAVCRAKVREPGDPDHCEVRGTHPVVEVLGNGVVRMSGENPRLYFYEPAANGHRWGNVEVTVYARRVTEDEPDTHQGFIVGARSEHQLPDVAKQTAYYGRLMYDGRANFTKELGHPCYAPPHGVRVFGWEHGVPRGVWVGMKFVVRDTPAGAVRLELYRDLTGGANGGTWERLTTLVDAGDWPTDPDDADCKFLPPATVLTGRTTSVFLRNTKAVTEYSRFTIREVEPAPG